MPLERENKYVLKAGKDLFKDLMKQVKNSEIEYSVADFRQGYLHKGSRVRHVNWRFLGGYGEDKLSAHDVPAEYIFTYKHKIDGDVVEIETEISPNDFERLWSETTNRLRKTRFSSNIPINHHNEHWENDFFHNSAGKIYFVMAECEMHHGKIDPTEMPDFIRDNMLLAKADNSIYSSRKLSDPKYAKNLMAELLKGSKK